MDEYIEREAVYEDFKKCNSVDPKWTPGRVMALIARQKTADVAPVRHGRWKKSNYHGFLCCSECKDVYIDKTWFGGGKRNYFPNCGAKMDSEVTHE